MTLFIFALLMMSQREIREKVMELALGIRATTSDNKQFDLFPVILFVVFLIGAVPAFIKLVGVVSADYWHRQALAQVSKSGTLTYQYLQRAESLNPQVDLYRVDMAQTNFALANAIAAQKGPTQDNPQGSLTDQDKRTIQTLLSQAINEGRAAVLLNPRSTRNWAVLAAIYRNISGVANNALAFSLDAYGRAIQRDPLNPVLRLNVGGIYYTAQNYDQAVRFFSDAINLKPDYANAYYNLAIALRDKNDLQNAKTVAAQTLVVLQNQKATDTPDYKVAQALVKEIDDKLANAAAATQAQTATADQTDSALGKEDVTGVNVSGLNTPPQAVVTPAPVKANPNARIPQPTATPTKAPTQ
jgi:tetratricopeptide (TPR) repeat protein